MQREELTLLRSRLNVAGYIVAAVLLILSAGFWHFQIAQSVRYTELADKNRLKQVTIIAKRGRILDREGRVIVDNRPSYNIVYVREGARHSLDEIIEMLSPLGLTPEEIKDRVARSRLVPKFRAIVLKEDVDVADIAFVNSRRLEFDEEISVEYQPRRRYLEGDLAAHALGYLGEVTPDELKRDATQYKLGDQVGKFGLELRYDSILRGKDGHRVVVVDRWQREIESLQDEFESPVKGNDLRTTLDLDLQRAAEKALGDQIGAAIAMNPTTGEVLVLASKPSFDPNLFAKRITTAAMQELNARKAFRNRAIQDRYAPGSVFKIFMAAAGIEAEVLNPYDHVNCSGEISFDGGRVVKHCWKAGGHGAVGLYEAIVNSCNVFFYNVGRRLDIDKIADYVMKMGLGQRTGIDLSGEDTGLIPSREWKARAYKTRTKAEQAWYPSETLDVSIGQGAVAVTPLQAAYAMGGLASGGRLIQPHLVDPKFLAENNFVAPKLKFSEYHVSATTVDYVAKGMWGVVNEGGTGTRAAVKGFDVAGKTGTAQVVNKKSYGKDESFEDHAWFVGFAPYRNPEIVVAAFVEHGGHGGTTAAPVAHAIFDTYFKKKTGQFETQTNGPIAQVKP